jgi:ubiquinone/menaquinone biosynthesis C-methylase UbiE
MNERVNYNKTSPVYNTRYQCNKMEGIESFIEKLVAAQQPQNILEIGCGTAHWLNTIANKYECNLFGADFSIGMLNVAHSSNNKLNLVNADANTLPIKESTMDLIIVINAIHHFTYPIDLLRHAMQVLKPNGILCIIGLEPRESRNNWFMYKYFTRTYEIDINRFPTFEEIKSGLIKTGSSEINIELVDKVNSRKVGRQILNDHFANPEGASQLALISDEEYSLGRNKMIADIEDAERKSEEIYFDVNLFFYALSCKKPI